MKKYLTIIMLVLCASLVYASTTMQRFTSLEVSNDMTDNGVENILMNQGPDPAEPGGYVELRVKVQNTGDEFATDTVFELMPQYPFSFDPGESSQIKIGTMYARQVGTDGVILYYKLRIDKNAVEGNNQLKLRYKTTNTGWIELKPFDVRIRTYDSILSVDSVESEPEVIAPGETAKVKIKLKNVADSLLKDIKVNIGLVTIYSLGTSSTLTELPLTPIGSTNEKTVEKLDSGEMVDVEFDLVADADADSKMYKVPITITYSDEVNMNYSINNYIGLKIGDTPGLSTILESSTTHTSGTKGEATIKFINKDAVDVKFLYLTLKPSDDFKLLSNEEVYIGNIDSDDYETTDVELFIKPGAKNPVNIPVAIEYKDPNNKKYNKNLNLKLQLYTKSEAVQYGLQKKSSRVGLFIVIAIIGAGLYLYRRWKKKKRK
ncbi:COG1361 S-layer family protein [Nanoarchaeota archaeon]